MEFADYGMHYADDTDHHIDLRNPHFRQEAYHHIPQHHHQPDFFAAHAHAQQQLHYANHLASLAVDVKPRLTKEQHDVLESHYQQQNKPNTQTKKGFAEALGVSLDKVNNWFQNRRAKSKQDAKKAAGQAMQSNPDQSQQSSQPASQTASQQPSVAQTPVPVSNDDLSAQFLSDEFLNSPPRDTPHHSVDGVSMSGLGITQDLPIHTIHESTETSMAPTDMLDIPGQSDIKSEDIDFDAHRRTMTQEQFDSLGHNDYMTGKAADSAIHESPTQLQGSDLLKDYFTELGDFNFGSANHDEMQTDFSNDTFGSSSSLFPDTGGSMADIVPRNPSTQSSISEWSETSTPSLSITPVVNHADSGYAASETEISPRGKMSSNSASGQWQPGTSVACDFEAMDREFREAAESARSQSASSGETSRHPSVAFADRQMSFASIGGDPSFTQSEAPAGLTQSMNNMGLSNEALHQPVVRGAGSAGGIAARRQRPRPQPLAASSLRSASYCGSLPTAPGVSGNAGLTPTAPTLRRIKSSNVMNGIASGRIQKSIAGAQRSPLNFTFAEAMNSPKFARRVSSYSPANGGMPVTSSSLAPPTPLSPTELSTRLEQQRQASQVFGAHHMSRQPSINELHEESHHSMLTTNNASSNMFSSPPTTPNYHPHLVRSRLTNGTMMENTPPQSAPATQQCFPTSMYSQAPQMRTTLSQAPMMTSQPHNFVPVMSPEYQPMHTMGMSSQPMQAGQYLQMLQAQEHMNGGGMNSYMSQQPMMYNAGMQFGAALSQPHPQQPGHQQITPPMQYPFVPSSPGHLLSTGHPQSAHHVHAKSVPAAADFFVHEYSPPQDVKRIDRMSPRKAGEGPKSYTFANQGPEHFEKSKKDGGSPGSEGSNCS